VSKAFGSKEILKEVSFRIDDGETFVVLGQSGSGKSVTLKHMIGLLKPDSGEVFVDGVDVNTISYGELRELRHNFGVLFQGGALFDSMTAADNVAFPLRMLRDIPEADVHERVAKCLEMVELPDAGEKHVAELSGGMQKRVALARAIALEPKYIFYDEPNSGLDPLTSHTINLLITSLADKLGVTSVVITHDIRAALDIADRIAFLHGGRIHWIGTVDDLHAATDPVLLDFVKASEYQIGPSRTDSSSGASFAPTTYPDR
ncbi:MAG: ABC transporter ATP-binding protein, partial [Bacteroidota bacterium]